MSVNNKIPKPLQKQRIINKETLLKQQIVEHTKKCVLASKIILDEDFDILLDTPLIFLPHVIKNYRPIVNTAISTVALLAVTKYCHKYYVEHTILALMPVTLEILNGGRHWYRKHKSFKQINEFVHNLENQVSVNRKIIKHLNMRINTMEELQNKVNQVAFDMIQSNDQKFAQNVGKVLENVCRTIQEQLGVQSKYSVGYYSYIGSWSLEKCPENGKIEDITLYIEKLSEFFILLSSNLMSSTIFSLEASMWREDKDFNEVFNTIKQVTIQIKQSITMINTELKQVFCDFHKTNVFKPKQTNLNKNNQTIMIYNESFDDCKNRIRIVFDLVKSIETNTLNAKTRYVFLEEMLEHFENSTILVRNLLKYEKSLLRHDNEENLGDKNEKQAKTDSKQATKTLINDREAEIGSDDEEFEYSPHESDDDFDQNLSRHEDFDHNLVQSVAVQNLMLQELRNRMKDVRRIKISRTAAGDLIVQERPVTLQQSGGQSELLKSLTSKIETEDVTPLSLPKFNVFPGNSLPPPPPPPMKYNISDDEIVNTNAIQPPVNVSLLASISSIAKQRNQNEDVFGCDGDEYVASDEFSSEDE